MTTPTKEDLEKLLAEATPEAVAQMAETMARAMLRVHVLPNWQFLDCMDSVDEETARELGVVFYNGKGYHAVDHIRDDERNDALAELVKRALAPSLTTLAARVIALETENATMARAHAMAMVGLKAEGV